MLSGMAWIVVVWVAWEVVFVEDDGLAGLSEVVESSVSALESEGVVEGPVVSRLVITV